MQPQDYSVSSAEDRPILDFRLRQTLHRIVHDKPLSTVDETETETSGNSGSEDSQARLHRLQQARTRSRRRRMGQSDDDIEQGRDAAALDAVSDEEREIGFTSGQNSGTL